jgi:molecular chaperone GrpE
MTDTTARADDAAAAPSDEAKTPAEPAAAALPAEPDAAALAGEVKELKDKLLRTLAEMENLRKRTEREIADVRAYGNAAFARDVLGIADNMGRALEAASGELHDTTDPATKALVEGVELTERELNKVLEKNGIRKFEPQGEKFDPNFHQAMFEVPDAEVPAGHVVQVVQAGYMIGERVLRPAMVGISKGNVTTPAAGNSANDNSVATPPDPPDPRDPPGAA